MKRKIALCLIVCLSLGLSPFSSVDAAEWKWNWEIIRLVSVVVAVPLIKYALKGYEILKDEDPEEVYRREKRYKRERDEEGAIRRDRERIFRESARGGRYKKSEIG